MGNGYNILFEVKISHDYYNNKACNDFDVVPTSETLLLLNNHRLLFRKKPGGFTILTPLNSNETKALIELDNNTKLSFQLVNRNLNFLNFTKLRAKSSSFDIYRFVSSSDPLEMKLNGSSIEIQTIKPKTFALELDKKYNAVTVKVYNEFGDYVHQTDAYKTAEQIADTDFNLSVPINLERSASGLYKFDIYENDILKQSLNYYLSNELKKIKPFGIVDIKNVTGNLLDVNNPKSFEIKFETKKSQWHYFVQLEKDYTGSDIVLEDKTASTPIGFDEYSGESEYKKGTILKFKSVDLGNSNADYEIPFSQTPLKKLEITISKNDTDINIKNIANPSVNNIKSEVYINI